MSAHLWTKYATSRQNHVILSIFGHAKVILFPYYIAFHLFSFAL